jgi:hypothetical protein
MGVQINGSEGNVIATKGTYSGNVTIGGTLTYEDVTNIDSVGLVTARTGIEIGARPGVAASISIDGNAIFSGITTIATLRATTGIVTAFQGDVVIEDKIIHSGDTNTAIRFPSADTITAETGGSESFRVDSSQRLLLGHTSSQTIGSNSHPLVQFNVNSNQAALSLARFENVSAGPSLNLGKSRGSSAGSYTVVQSGDGLGSIFFAGADGTDLVTTGAVIEAQVDGTPGSNDMPGRIVFKTTADGASSPTERLRIDSNGRLLLGTDTARAVGGESNPVLHIEGSGNTSNSWVNITRFQSTTAGPNLQFAKARSNTPGTYTLVQSDDTLGTISFLGADGTDMANYAATIKAEVDGTAASNDMPGRLVFSTTSDGSGTATERMRIRNNGLVTKPYQYYLLVDRSSDLGGYDANGSFGTPLIFNRIVTEQKDSSMSSAFNTSTGLFTAPVSGVYQLIASAYNISGVSFTQSWFTYNGGRMSYSDWVAATGVAIVQNSQIVYLAAGSTVGYHPHAGGGNTSITIQANGNHTYMKITLLH